jgi:hypothetical protein
MLIFNYDKETRLFTTSGIAAMSPLEPGHYLIPSNATAVPPPTDLPAHKSAQWTDDHWEAVDDWRGETVYSIHTGKPLTVTYLGNVLEADFVETPPPSVYHQWDTELGEWVLNAAVAIAAQEQAIKDLRDRKMTEGVQILGYWWHTDAESVTNYLGLKDDVRDMLVEGALTSDPIMRVGHQVQWKTQTGAFVPLTVQIVLTVSNGVKDFRASLFYIGEAHIANMRLAENPLEYDYTSGWPQTYADYVASH